MCWIVRIERGIEIPLAIYKLKVLRERKTGRQTRSAHYHIVFGHSTCCDGSAPGETAGWMKEGIQEQHCLRKS